MTTTLKLNGAEIVALREQLESQGFSFKPLDYAHFSARGSAVVVNAYKSGKVVVQGKGAEAFLEMAGLAPEAAPVLAVPTAGSDESGKGDYFGPLVVAAVVVDPGQADTLARAGVRDCKRMSDNAIMKAAVAIRDLCPHAIENLLPADYNDRHEEEGNVALFMSTMHAAAIAKAIEAAPACEQVVIDQFTFAERLETALHDAGVDLPVDIRPRAEDNLAVAAASVLARAEFLITLRELGQEHGLELPKGANPIVETVARRIFRAGGMDELHTVAKTHFKTTTRVTEHLF